MHSLAGFDGSVPFLVIADSAELSSLEKGSWETSRMIVCYSHLWHISG